MVLLSQRRRWINSTIHNLMELLFVHDLCGTFCFSMQFVIFMELVGTLALPAAISFTIYLIVMACLGQPAVIPLILLALILGLPAVLIVMTSRKVIYVGWMLVYLISLPIWNFVLPTYAYWHFDDFSWGDTRKVEGAVADKKGGHADKSGEFDSSLIVMKKWSEFEKDRRIKEAFERNLPAPRFMEKPKYSMDVFHSTPVPVKRYSKTGSAGSNDSDVPLTQMGYVPAGSTATSNRGYEHSSAGARQQQVNDDIIDTLAIEENSNKRSIIKSNSPASSSTTTATGSSLGPDIPLTTIHRTDSQESPSSSSTYDRPRAQYNAGLAGSGIRYEEVEGEDFLYEETSLDNNHTRFASNAGSSSLNWSDPAPHHHQQHSGAMDLEFTEPSRSSTSGSHRHNNIPVPPPHDFKNNR